jgi:hypothetical protein
MAMRWDDASRCNLHGPNAANIGQPLRVAQRPIGQRWSA